MKRLKKHKIVILIALIILLIFNCKKVELNCYTCTQSVTVNNDDYVFIKYITTICGESETDIKTIEKMNTYDEYIMHYKTKCELNH
jgi:hypothetical protein